VIADWTDSNDSTLDRFKSQGTGQIKVTVDWTYSCDSGSGRFKWPWIGQIQVSLHDIFKW